MRATGLTMEAPVEAPVEVPTARQGVRAYPVDRCVHELFEAQAAATPAAIAVVYEDELVRYDALNARANRLAHHLRALGVGPDVLVGLCVERGIDMVVGLLGILKAGGAYVPLDPEYPAERLRFLVEDSAPRVVLTQEAVRSRRRLPALDVPVVVLDAPDDMAAIARASSGNPSHEAIGLTVDHLAYVIYTSGSTGQPKGTCIQHRSLTNLLLSIAHAPGMTAADSMLAVTTLSFDIAALELFLPLICGARMVIMSSAAILEPHIVSAAIGTHAITFIQATPSLWRLLIDAGWAGSETLTVLCGGEALTPALAADLRRRCKSLWNMYGPTETTIWSTACHVDGATDTISIGWPLGNTTVYVLDPHLAPVPEGVTGELVIGGLGVAAGYLNNPTLTAERFVDDPFSAAPGARLYRTGDLGRYDPARGFIIHGRRDQQVKIRGHRIELGEVEAVLAAHPEVGQAAVLTRAGRGGALEMVAFVSAKRDAIDVAALRRHMKASVPGYLIPSLFVVLDDLPMTFNGKIDRKALTTRL